MNDRTLKVERWVKWMNVEMRLKRISNAGLNVHNHLSSNKIYIVQKKTENWFSIHPMSS